jgi:hypothetical protein
MADGFSQIETEVRVRVGTPSDVDEVMELALLGCAENRFVPESRTKVLQDVWAGLTLQAGIIGIIGDPGQKPLEGAVLLRVGNVWYSDALTVEERAIFVHPSYRSAKGGRAARLAEFSKRVADYLDLPLTIGVLSSHRTKAKIRMYSRIMGEPSGAYWIYWPNERTVDVGKTALIEGVG